MNKGREVFLKVAEAFQQDVGYGRARIDTQTRVELDISIGDVIEIKGGKVTAATVWRAHPEDEGKNLIRMDKLTRKNAKVSLGDSVRVKKAEVKDAVEVTLAPIIPESEGQIQFGAGIENFIRKGLLRRAVVKGDTVIVPGIALFGSALPFGIIDTSPKGIVIITENTRLIVKEEAPSISELEVPRVGYEDIGGLHKELLKVREMIELPLKHPELFERLGIDPPKGVLLHGPPGTGKTLIARAVANESGASFFTINGPEIMSKFYGQSEENLRKVFQEAEKNAPSIIFIDEIDAIAPKRSEVHGEVERRVVSQLLTLLDGLKGRGKVIVIAATNLPDAIDPALRRPGRFDREIRIGVPDRNGRKEILQIHTRSMPRSPPFYRDIVLDSLKEWIKDIEIPKLEKEIKMLEEDRERLEENRSKIVELKRNIADKKAIKKLLELQKRLTDDQLRILIEGPKEIEKTIEAREESSEVKSMRKAYEGLKKVLESIEDDEIRERLKEGAVSEELKETIRKKSLDRMLDDLADITYGFVGADLAALAREAAMNALRRYLPEIDLEKPIPTEVLEKMEVNMNDFKEALKGIEPSAIREFFVEVPKVSWDDVGGLEDVKQSLREAVEWPLKKPKVFQRMGIKPPRGILLYGPPGTGKTLLAKAVANESNANFISIKGPEILSKWVGESERAVRELFKRAKQVAPTIVFLDELDAIAPRRGAYTGSHVTESVVNQLLTSMDGLESMEGVVVIGATNRPDIIDPGLLRPGRFDRLLLVPAPDLKARFEILKIHTRNMPIRLTSKEVENIKKELEEQKEADKIVDIGDISKLSKLSDKELLLYKLAKDTEGFSGADLESLCREAAMNAIRKDEKADAVTLSNFEDAFKAVRGSITKEMMEYYKKISEELGSRIGKKDKKEIEIQYL